MAPDTNLTGYSSISKYRIFLLKKCTFCFKKSAYIFNFLYISNILLFDINKTSNITFLMKIAFLISCKAYIEIEVLVFQGYCPFRPPPPLSLRDFRQSGVTKGIKMICSFGEILKLNTPPKHRRGEAKHIPKSKSPPPRSAGSGRGNPSPLPLCTPLKPCEHDTVMKYLMKENAWRGGNTSVRS